MAKPKSESPAALTPVVTFAFLEPHAQRVSLSGEFNGWAAEGTPLSRQDDGLWSTRLALAPGRYQYKFVVDGQWLTDPNAQENIHNEYGTLNSIVEVQA